MNEQKFLVLCLVIFLVAGISTLRPSYATNEFVAGYFTNSQSTATIAILGTDFLGTSPSSIPSGSWIASLVNIAGAYQYGSCPCLYQTGFIIDNTGNVAVSAQYWGTSGSLYSSQTNNVGTTSSYSFYEEIRYFSTSSTIQSQGFEYNTLTQLRNNAPTVTGFSYVYTGDSSFYYGSTSITCGTQHATLERYQVGIESPNIGSGTWYVNQYSAEVYTSSWLYQAAQSTEGNADPYDCISGSLYGIGGAQMTGVNLYTTNAGTDAPSWDYTGTTIGNGHTLWSSSGGSTPLPCKVLGRC